MSKDEKCTCKARKKYCFSLSNMQICGGFVAVVMVVPTLKCVPHVQHDYFSSFNQSYFFVASFLPLLSSLIKHSNNEFLNVAKRITNRRWKKHWLESLSSPFAGWLLLLTSLLLQTASSFLPILFITFKVS